MIMKLSDKEKIFKALGDSNRLTIMDLISEKELNAGQILSLVKMGQSTLSHHMKILCDSGIVTSRKDSRWVYYSINAEVAQEASNILAGWIK